MKKNSSIEKLLTKFKFGIKDGNFHIDFKDRQVGIKIELF